MTTREEHNSLLESIFGNTLTMIAYLDADFNFLKVNKAYASADGKEPGFFTGKNHFELFPNEENERLFREVLKTGEPYFAYARAFEYEYNPERGVTHWDWSLQPVKDDEGNVTSLILHLVDVTRRIQAEENLQIERNFNNTVFDVANALIVVLDRHGRIYRFNPACEKITGYTFEEIRNTRVWEHFIRKDEVEQVKSVFDSLQKNGLEGEFTNYWVARDGSERLIHWNNSVISEGENVQFIVSVGIDITEKEKIRTQLRHSEETMKNAQQAAHIGTWDWDIETGKLVWSEEIFNIFGVDPDAFRGTYEEFTGFVHPDDIEMVQKEVERCVSAAEDEYNIEHRIIRPDQTIRYVVETGKVYFNKKRPVRMIGIVQDVTEKKLASLDLERNREMLNAFMDSVTDGIVIFDSNFCFLEINKTAMKGFRLDKEKVIGRHILDEYPPLRDSGRYEKYLDVIRTGKPYFADDIYTHPEYGDKIISIKAFKVGEGMGLITTDVTARVKAEKALQEELEYTQYILDSLPLGMAIYDVNGDCISANPAVAKMVGAKVEQVLQQNYHKIESWKKSGLYDIALAAIKSGQKQRHEFIIETTFGKKTCLDCQLVPFYRKGKQHMMLIIDDIEERLKSEEALRESEKRYQMAVRGSNDGIWDWNVETGEDYFSPRFRELLGYHEEDEFPEVLDSFVGRLHPDDSERVARAMQNHLEHNEPYNIELRLRKKDGSYSWFLSRGQAVWGKNGKPLRMAGSVTDISSQKEYQAELAMHRENLEELVKERTRELENAQNELVRKERLATLGQLTATVSHELRNPLGAMRPSLYIVEKRMVKGDEKMTAAIERIKRSINRCDHIIDELLDFTRDSKLEKIPVKIDEWLEKIINEQALPRGICLEKKFSLGGLVCEIDPDRLRRAVINIFENGCHAMAGNSASDIKEGACLKISSEKNHDDRIVLSVEDNGSGIAPEILSRIFEPLFSTKGFGVGLGMSAVRQVMEQHGGGVDVETEPGKGSIFRLWLPCEGGV